MPGCAAALIGSPIDSAAEGGRAGMAHVVASIDIAATMAKRNADDLGKATGALGVCLETLEHMMVLSTSISSVLGEVAASELARADLERHFEQIVRIMGVLASLTGKVARDIAADGTPAGPAQNWGENIDLLLERAQRTTDEIPPVLAQVGSHVRQVADGLDRSRSVAERSIAKAKSAHTVISSLRDQFDRNRRHMTDLAAALTRGTAQAKLAAEGVARQAPGERRGGAAARAATGSFVETTTTDLEQVAMSVTDVFVAGAGQADADQVDLFGTLLTRLAKDLATAARRRLAERLAPVPHAPAVVVTHLALDPDISVARPVLQLSEVLGDADLVRVACERGEEHMVAIAGRATLSETVTDTLVDRGSNRIVRLIAANEGAKFSGAGIAALVGKARHDPLLATTLQARQDLPPTTFAQLLEQATASAVADIGADSADNADVRATVAAMMHGVADEIEARTRAFAAMRAELRLLAEGGGLDAALPQRLVQEGRYEHALAAIAELCDVPDDVVLRFSQPNGANLLLILAKAAQLDWASVHAGLRARVGGADLGLSELAAAKESYARLQPATCQRIVGFWKSRPR